MIKRFKHRLSARTVEIDDTKQYTRITKKTGLFQTRVETTFKK